MDGPGQWCGGERSSKERRASKAHTVANFTSVLKRRLKSNEGTFWRRRWQWFQRNRPININHYANKKSAAESMLDIALLMANASQLKAVMEQGPSFSFYVPLIILIGLSLTLQVMVGVLLIFLGI
nr:ninjurin-1 isoform X2 [Taeniopygia guttata]